MRGALASAALMTFLGGCGFVDSYEEAVHDFEPLYCYQSLAGVECFREPHHKDALRLVNYFGPHPSRFEAPEPPEVEHFAPKSIDLWVKDPEPVPEPRMKLQYMTSAQKQAENKRGVAQPTEATVEPDRVEP